MQLADCIHWRIPACRRDDMCLFGPGLLPSVLATGMQLRQASGMQLRQVGSMRLGGGGGASIIWLR